jgi:hypothetical protein
VRTVQDDCPVEKISRNPSNPWDIRPGILADRSGAVFARAGEPRSSVERVSTQSDEATSAVFFGQSREWLMVG